MSRDDSQGYDDSDPMNPYRGYSPPPSVYRPTSGLAIASFVCGLVVCVPFITSTLAVVFGIAGLRATRNPYVGGRNWAISGTILGVMGLGLWLFMGSLFYMGLNMVLTEQGKAEKVATQFVQNLSDGKVAEATESLTSGVDRGTLAETVEAIKASGPFNELSGEFQPIPVRGTLEFRFEFTGDAVFSRDRKPLRMSLEKDDDGDYKIDRFRLGRPK